MELDYRGNPIQNSQLDIISFIKELEERLKIMEEKDIYVIDRFEEDFALCENRATKEIINIKKEKLPKGAKEGSILKYTDGKYILDSAKQKEIEEKTKNKMNNLWN